MFNYPKRLLPGFNIIFRNIAHLFLFNQGLPFPEISQSTYHEKIIICIEILQKLPSIF